MKKDFEIWINSPVSTPSKLKLYHKGNVIYSLETREECGKKARDIIYEQAKEIDAAINTNKLPANISKEDYVLWDLEKDIPKESFDIIYHYTTVIDLVNDGFTLNKKFEFRQISSLEITWQRLYNYFIEKDK